MALIQGMAFYLNVVFSNTFLLTNHVFYPILWLGYIGFFGGESKKNSPPVKSNRFVFQLEKAVNIYLWEDMVCKENSRDARLFKKVCSDCHTQTSS